VKCTDALSILGEHSMDERTVHLHPNDGFDLGLMSTEYVVRLYVGKDAQSDSIPEERFIYGKLHLKNNVRHGVVELGLRAADRLGQTERARVYYEPGNRYGRVRIAPAP
jgi:hypothetical protein